MEKNSIILDRISSSFKKSEKELSEGFSNFDKIPRFKSIVGDFQKILVAEHEKIEKY